MLIDSVATSALSIASMIDHTLLKADACEKEIIQLCREAIEYGFYGVCINPYWVPFCYRELVTSSCVIATVIGFPLGAIPTVLKVKEAEWCLEKGAKELDMVINIGGLKSSNFQTVENDIRSVVKAAPSAQIKVILETSLLTLEEKQTACSLAINAGAHYVKTSTGFSKGGATLEDVSLLRQSVKDLLGVKASGGIRQRAEAEAMIAAGANRIGTSAGCKIIEDRNSCEGVY